MLKKKLNNMSKNQMEARQEWREKQRVLSQGSKQEIFEMNSRIESNVDMDVTKVRMVSPSSRKAMLSSGRRWYQGVELPDPKHKYDDVRKEKLRKAQDLVCQNETLAQNYGSKMVFMTTTSRKGHEAVTTTLKKTQSIEDRITTWSSQPVSEEKDPLLAPEFDSRRQFRRQNAVKLDANGFNSAEKGQEIT